MRRLFLRACLLIAVIVAAASGFAAYREQPVKLIVPWAAGTSPPAWPPS
ncbi:MAG: hypothetical protein ACREJV_04735 [Candidatus Rokuibacteriota bacterium]